jgi:tetratricopeptide (TPR) repeat protein
MRQGLGTIMVEAGLITEAQLDETLELQKVYSEKLASILVRQNHLTEKFAVTYLGRQLGVPGVDMSKHAISLDLLRLVPLVVCNRELVFPIGLEQGLLQLAMADPLDQDLVARLAQELQVRLSPSIALEASIKNAIEEAAAAVKAGRRTFTPSALHDRLATFSLDPRQRPLPPGTGPLPVVVLEKDRSAPIVEKLGGGTVAYDQSFTKTGLKPVSRSSLTVPDEPQGERPAPTPGEARQASEEAAPVEEPAPRKVVLVDGNPDTRRAMAELLGKSESLRVVGVGSAADALPQLADTPLLIVRRGLRHENALELCREARALSTDLRIVLITPSGRGWAYQADVRDALKVDLVLGPPLDGPRLREQVEELVGLGKGPDAEQEAAVKKSLRAGVAGLKRENVDEAIEALRDGLEKDPRSDLLNYYLGKAYERKGRTEDAIDYYEQAIETNPEFGDALVCLATLYERTGMRRKSVEIWQRVLSTTSDASSQERIKSHIMELL